MYNKRYKKQKGNKMKILQAWKSKELEILHTWKSEELENEAVVTADWYQDNGTPQDDYGRDMILDKVELFSNDSKIEIDINQVFDVWRAKDGDEIWLNPDWYQKNGTPVDVEGLDYEYIRSFIKIEN